MNFIFEVRTLNFFFSKRDFSPPLRDNSKFFDSFGCFFLFSKYNITYFNLFIKLSENVEQKFSWKYETFFLNPVNCLFCLKLKNVYRHIDDKIVRLNRGQQNWFCIIIIPKSYFKNGQQKLNFDNQKTFFHVK